MLVKFPQLQRVGRFVGWDGQRTDELRFRRLTLIYGRNAAGKSTIARVCNAAASHNAAELELDRTLGSMTSPQVTMEFDNGKCRFNGSTWTGHKPKVVTFDRRFVESNVYVGRHSSKEHRRELLRLALGPEDAAHARELDELTRRGRDLAIQRNPHQAAIDAASRAFDLSIDEFLRLTQLSDINAARTQAQQRLREAELASEIEKRPRPRTLPALPPLDLDGIRTILGRNSKAIADEAAANVRAHFDSRLKGRGETWIRTGLQHVDGKTCPFCAQPVQGVDLVTAYQSWFDKSYERLLSAIDDHSRAASGLEQWWQHLKVAGQANLKAFEAWQGVEGVVRPDFDSSSRKQQLDEIETTLRTLLDSKRQDPTRSVDSTVLSRVAELVRTLRLAVEHYNVQIEDALKVTNGYLQRIGGVKAEDARRALRMIDAAEQRFSEPILVMMRERARIDGELEQVRKEKEAADERMRERSGARLSTFADRMNFLLTRLCADFRLDDLGTERTGGATGARFTLRVDNGHLEVSNAASEDRFARVLSDGDRSTLAFAIFLLSLEETQDLAEHIVVIDDPMTSQDSQRTEATAEQITALVAKTKQVIVLSHHTPFLHQIVYDWKRNHHGPNADLAELELDKGSKALRTWSAEASIRHEYQRRISEMETFVASTGSDRDAPRMQGEIRKLLEGHMHALHPEFFQGTRTTLEPVIERLRDDPEALRRTRWTLEDITELDRLCSFGARGNHFGSVLRTDEASPEQIRLMAKRALDFIRMAADSSSI